MGQPSKIAKLKKNIQNFQKLDGESLYEVWVHYNGLLRNCPQQYLNVQQEIYILDSQGPMTKKELETNKSLIEEFTKHLREYHNPRDDFTRGKPNGDRRTRKCCFNNCKARAWIGGSRKWDIPFT